MEARQRFAMGFVFGQLLCACAGTPSRAQMAREALRNGNPEGPPTMQSLPDVAKSSASPRVQSGMTLARQVLATRIPAPPSDRSYQHLQSWIDHDVVPWVTARRESVDETRFQFGLEDGASDDERVVATAVIGLLQEDTALALASIPSPSELDTEPEVEEMFRDLVRTQSEPFQNAALDQYRTCANRAYESSPELRRWALYCHKRFDHLEGQLQAMNDAH